MVDSLEMKSDIVVTLGAGLLWKAHRRGGAHKCKVHMLSNNEIIKWEISYAARNEGSIGNAGTPAKRP